MQRVTLRDIARAAGVDTSTVSRVLNGDARGRVGDDTRERVLKLATELNYSPNMLARGLRTRRLGTLGIVVPQLDNPVFCEAIRGATEVVEDAGFHVVIAHRVEQQGDRDVYRRLSEVNRLDGLLVASLDDEPVFAEAMAGVNAPVVLFNRARFQRFDAVTLDTRAASRIGIEHLAALGHRRIAHIGGRPGGFNAGQRRRGFLDAMNAHGLEVDPALVVEAGYTPESGLAAMRGILAGPVRPTAVLTATILSAIGVLAAVHEAGLTVPADISVVGIHDAPAAEMTVPPLTTVATPAREMGREAAKLLLAVLDSQLADPVPPLAPLGLVERRSTAACRG